MGVRIGQGVGHLQGHVALIPERERKGDGLILNLRCYKDGISRAALRTLELIAALFRVQGCVINRRGDDLRITCAFAFQGKAIIQKPIVKLIMLNCEIYALVCITEEILRCNRFFVPSELEL